MANNRRVALFAMLAVAALLGASALAASQLAGGDSKLHLYRLKISGIFPPPTFPADNPLTEEGVALGRRLFFDPSLSQDGNVSCATCHHAEQAFSDGGKPLSHGVRGAVGRRNTQPLFNLAWRRGFFWDGRASTLRDQVMHPIADPKEMARAPEELVSALARDPIYAAKFAEAFPGETPTTGTLGKALEQFLLVQISQDSRLDRAHRGEGALTPKEQRGFELFFSEFDPGHGRFGADCFHCHGNALFTNERYANNGLVTKLDDTGRQEVTGKAWERWCYKVPTLRNIAVTGPYMHDGRFATLEEVVEHYDHEATGTLTLDPNIAKHQGNLHLSREDKEALVAFLKTLTDDDFLSRASAEQAAAKRD